MYVYKVKVKCEVLKSYEILKLSLDFTFVDNFGRTYLWSEWACGMGLWDLLFFLKLISSDDGTICVSAPFMEGENRKMISDNLRY